MLKRLEDFNVQRRERLRAMHDPSPVANGVACPRCSKEMMDSSPMMTLTSNPPQKHVHCPACGYCGYRVA